MFASLFAARPTLVVGGVLSLVVHAAALAAVSVSTHSRSVAAPLDGTVLVSLVEDTPEIVPATRAPAAPTVPQRLEPARARKVWGRRVLGARIPRATDGATAQLRIHAPVPAPPPLPLPEPAPTAAAPRSPIAQPTQPVEVTPGVAQGLRVYDMFPSMPGSMRFPGATQALTMQVCVSTSGAVSGVSFAQGRDSHLGRALREAILTWRYRPMMVDGAARPFCHPVRIEYRYGRS